MYAALDLGQRTTRAVLKRRDGKIVNELKIKKQADSVMVEVIPNYFDLHSYDHFSIYRLHILTDHFCIASCHPVSILIASSYFDQSSW